MVVLAVIFYLLFFVYLYLLHRGAARQAHSLGNYILLFFLNWVATTIPAGYLLSWLHLIAAPWAWGVALVANAMLLYMVVGLFAPYTNFNLRIAFKQAQAAIGHLFTLKNGIERTIFILLFLGVSITSGLLGYVFVVAYPNEWDSMTGHLVKCAYYLQQGHMGRLQGTTWTIDFYPNALPTLQLFGYHALGEKGFKLIHFLSYGIFVISLYKIARRLVSNKAAAVFIGLMAALLPTALIQATTTETDLVFSAYLGLLIYFLLDFAYQPSRWKVVLIALSVGIWMSHKVTFILVVPPVLMVTALIIWKTRSFFSARNTGFVILALTASILLYVLPNGYVANVKEVGELRIGSLSAPKEVMRWHGIENYSTAEKVANFKLNVARYTSDFLHLDGLRSSSTGNEINQVFRKPLDAVFRQFDLEQDRFWVVQPFRFVQDTVIFYKERPYWGIIGFGLVLPSLLIAVGYFFRRRATLTFEEKITFIFLLAGILHFLSLCLSAPYDPIKARYFMNMACWFLPLIGFIYMRVSKVYLLPVSVIVVVAAISTLLFRQLIPLTGSSTISNLSRVEQLLRTRPGMTPAYEKFEQLVPQDAIVALGTQQEHEDYEYPLFGANFSRHLIPLHPFRSAVKPIPAEAEYLFYSEGVFPYQQGDIQLNSPSPDSPDPVGESTFFLRKLKK